MSQLGVDYASVDSNESPDFQQARSAGCTFAYIRRSHCYYDRTHSAWRLAHDPVYTRDASRARGAGLVVGAYLFPSFAVGAPSPDIQVTNFELAGGEVLPGDLPVALDVEFPGRGIADTGRTRAEVFRLVLDFLRLLRQKHQTVAVYTSHVQWHDDNGLGGPDSSELDGVMLWIKTPYRLKPEQRVDTILYKEPHFGNEDWDANDYWMVPAPWRDQGWWIQQGQGDALGFRGFNHTVDVNHFDPVDTYHVSGQNFEPRVRWIQRQLVRHVGRAGAHQSGVTGLLDTSTLDAIVAFQSSHGLVADGIVGVRTFAALCG